MGSNENLVMIIDDNEFDSFFTKRLIKNSGFSDTILEFESAENALDYIESSINDGTELPKFIFLDIYMPIMTGFDFFEELKKFPQSSIEQCHLVFTSTTVDDNNILKVNSLGHKCSFTSKPITTDFLDTLKPLTI
jgi:CheY-like chemotaxis protein